MVILHILKGRCNPDTANGVEKTIFNLATRQAKSGHEVTILGFSDKKPIPIDGFEVIHLPYPANSLLHLPNQVAQVILGTNAEIVHFHSVYIPIHNAISRLLIKRHIPYIVTPNGGCSPEVARKNRLLKIPYKHIFELPYLNNASVIHSVGDCEALEKYGITSRIERVPNGIALESIPKMSDEVTRPTLYPEWESKTIFTFLGRLAVRQKGLDIMLDGFHHAHQQDSSIALALIGPDFRNGKQYLEDRIAKLKLNKSVKLVGPIYGDTRFDHLRASDYFIHTSRWEGLPFSLVEAMAVGTPCFITKAANPCMLIDSNSGLQVDLGKESISDGFLNLSRISSTRRDEIGERAYELVRKHFQWDTISDQLIDIYKSVIKP